MLLTPSVKEALLLENELIKQHRPPFNVRLRDDKQYLGLRLDLRQTWPRLTQVRRFERDGALYFGPYTSSGALHQSLAQLRRIFPLRIVQRGRVQGLRPARPALHRARDEALPRAVRGAA